MLRASQERILERLGEDDLVLDIGGWASPFARADCVLDLMPYDTRSPYEWSDRAADQRFTKETWVERDICDKEPYPFHDDQFDFVVCAQTLEDVRDPIWVCSEMRRIGKAGYIEVPSRLLEQTHGVHGGAWVGYSHHHWLIDVHGDRITFVFKHHIINRPGFHFPDEFADALRPDERAAVLWWEGSFEFEELILEPAETDAYLQDFVTAEMKNRGVEHPTEGARAPRGLLERARRAVGRN